MTFKEIADTLRDGGNVKMTLMSHEGTLSSDIVNSLYGFGEDLEINLLDMIISFLMLNNIDVSFIHEIVFERC